VTHPLDTNTCVVYLRQTSAGIHVATRLAKAAPGSVGLCSVVVAELLFGVYRSKQVVKNLQQTTAFCGRFVSHPFDDIAADEYGRLRADLEANGTPIGPNDTMFAATALVKQRTLVTHNTAEFSSVPGLTIDDWQVP
jgi:tRNA(fMet)-specific endonuclease VapC